MKTLKVEAVYPRPKRPSTTQDNRHPRIRVWVARSRRLVCLRIGFGGSFEAPYMGSHETGADLPAVAAGDADVHDGGVPVSTTCRTSMPVGVPR